jgi:hypothetical protein
MLRAACCVCDLRARCRDACVHDARSAMHVRLCLLSRYRHCLLSAMHGIRLRWSAVLLRLRCVSCGARCLRCCVCDAACVCILARCLRC